MNTTTITLQGTLKSDGSLEIQQPVALPAGPVQVTIQTLPSPKESVWAVLEEIWAEHKASGRPSRTKEEIDSDILSVRDELEESALAAERIQEEAQQARKQSPC